MFALNYDSRRDILYARLPTYSGLTYSVENVRAVTFYYNAANDEIVGFSIMRYNARVESGEIICKDLTDALEK